MVLLEFRPRESLSIFKPNGRYSINAVIKFIRDALLREKPITPIEGLMELRDNLTARRELLASSTILSYKELNELHEAACKMREILCNKVYLSSATRRTLFGENGQNSAFYTNYDDKQCYMFWEGDENLNLNAGFHM